MLVMPRAVNLTILLCLYSGLSFAQGPEPIPDTQDPSVAPFFIGKTATAKPLKKKANWQPALAPMQLHEDIANSDTSDFAGPLGRAPQVNSYFMPGTQNWAMDETGRLTVANRMTGGYMAIEPKTFRLRGTISPPAGYRFNNIYAYMQANGRLVVPSNGINGQRIFIIDREDRGEQSYFTISRKIDLSKTLNSEEPLMAIMPDADNNIWFATGGILGIPGTQLPSYSTIGYIAPNNSIKSIKLEGEIVENGFATAGKQAFIVTSKALYAFSAEGEIGGVSVLWRQQYETENKIKQGGFAMGSGSSVTLLGDDYVAITDNAAEQINLLIFKRGDASLENRLLCSVPLFEKGRSSLDVSFIGHQNSDGSYSVIAANIYDAPRYIMMGAVKELNGAFNDYNVMAPGLSRVDISADGRRCQVKWEAPIKSTVVYKLSAANGLVYGITQDLALAEKGIYVWYFTAIDYQTGEQVFNVRAGAGGIKNYNFGSVYVLQDGGLMATVLGGFITLHDTDNSKVK